MKWPTPSHPFSCPLTTIHPWCMPQSQYYQKASACGLTFSGNWSSACRGWTGPVKVQSPVVLQCYWPQSQRRSPSTYYGLIVRQSVIQDTRCGSTISKLLSLNSRGWMELKTLEKSKNIIVTSPFSLSRWEHALCRERMVSPTPTFSANCRGLTGSVDVSVEFQMLYLLFASGDAVWFPLSSPEWYDLSFQAGWGSHVFHKGPCDSDYVHWPSLR